MKPADFDPEIDRVAAEWFGRREVGLTAGQEREFQCWLRANPRHAVHYGQFDETWALLGELEPRKHARANTERAGELERREFHARRRNHGWWPALALAAAAVVAIVVVSRAPRQGDAVRYVAATAPGGMKKFDLPDGSAARLNANSRIEVAFSATERLVDLIQGEAHFTVEKNPARPFIVRARGVSVRAVGTAFNVALKPTSLEVIVTEGKVNVVEATIGQSILPHAGTGPIEPVLVAGQRAVVPLESAATQARVAAVSTLSEEVAEKSLAWQARQLEFDAQPLADVVAEFNRYNQHQLIIADPELGRMAFGGTFRADNSEAFVELLESRFGVVAERSGLRTTLRLRKDH